MTTPTGTETEADLHPHHHPHAPPPPMSLDMAISFALPCLAYLKVGEALGQGVLGVLAGSMSLQFRSLGCAHKGGLCVCIGGGDHVCVYISGRKKTQMT